jgi:hypothetical protein
MTTQGDRHSSFRAIGGGTGGFGGDAMTAMATELEAAELDVPETFNGLMVAWLQLRLTSSDDNLPGLLRAFAEQESASHWSGVGDFDPLP